MQKLPLVIATRKSKLALWQANWIIEQLASNDHFEKFAPELLEMESQGDLRLDQRLSYIGGKGLFTEDLERQIINGKAHIAVHSLKDVPLQSNKDFYYRYTSRDYSGDVIIFPDSGEIKKIDDLAPGSVIGTSSVRRQALLANLYPHLQVKVLRGNVNTRLAKLNTKEEGLDAIILAKAGLTRLGILENLKHHDLDPTSWIPAPGQGIVAVQFYRGNEVSDYAQYFGNDATAFCAEIERNISLALGGSCSLPIGVHMSYVNSHGHRLCGKEVSRVWDEFISTYVPSTYNKDNPNNPRYLLDISGAIVDVFVGDFTGGCYRQTYRFDNQDLTLEPSMLSHEQRNATITKIVDAIANDIRANGFEDYRQSVESYLNKAKTN